jgi:putative ATPase
MKELDYGKGYLYSHDHPGNFANQEFMPEDIAGTNFFQAGSSQREQELQKNLDKLWKGKYKG